MCEVRGVCVRGERGLCLGWEGFKFGVIVWGDEFKCCADKLNTVNKVMEQ